MVSIAVVLQDGQGHISLFAVVLEEGQRLISLFGCAVQRLRRAVGGGNGHILLHSSASSVGKDLLGGALSSRSSVADAVNMVHADQMKDLSKSMTEAKQAYKALLRREVRFCYMICCAYCVDASWLGCVSCRPVQVDLCVLLSLPDLTTSIGQPQ